MGLPPLASTSVQPTLQTAQKTSLVVSFAVLRNQKAELLSDCLRSLRRNHKNDQARVKRAFQTLYVFVRNVVKNPDVEKFRKIRVTNPIFQENYVNYRPSSLGKDENEMKRMNALARAAESIADILLMYIRRYRQWQLSPSGCVSSCIIPAALMHGHRETFMPGERNFNRFGGWLGKVLNSREEPGEF